MGKVDAHGLGGDLVVADGLERAAIGRVDEQHDNGNADADDHERHECIRKIWEAAQQLRAVGNGRERLQLNERADNFGKAERGDGQIVAFEFQNGQADQIRQHSGQKACQQQGHEYAENRTCRIAEHVLKRFGQGELEQRVIILIYGRPDAARDIEDSECICTNQHEACLPEREQACEAVQEVHGYGDKGVDRALAQNRREHDGDAGNAVKQERQQIDKRKTCDGQNGLQREAFFLFHMLLLRLSLSAFHRTGPSA